MKSLILAIAILFLAGTVLASDYTIRSRYPDYNPGDGWNEQGSYTNPYVVEDDYGQEVGTISPRYPDHDPNDGFMDPGSYSNPYEYEDSGW